MYLYFVSFKYLFYLYFRIHAYTLHHLPLAFFSLFFTFFFEVWLILSWLLWHWVVMAFGCYGIGLLWHWLLWWGLDVSVVHAKKTTSVQYRLLSQWTTSNHCPNSSSFLLFYSSHPQTEFPLATAILNTADTFHGFPIVVMRHPSCSIS